MPCEAQRVPTDFPIPDKMAAELRHPIHNMGPVCTDVLFEGGGESEKVCALEKP